MKRELLALVLLTTAGITGTLRAQDDAPGRGVARISVIHGDVSVRRGDSGDWVAAAVNAPVMVEDRILTGPGSRAEVQFDWANMLRLAGNAELRLAELENNRYQVQVARGTVTFRMLRDSQAEVEISTPSVAVRPAKRGTYRISVHDDGTSEIAVRSGDAEIFTPGGSEPLRAGQTMLVRGNPSDPEFQIVPTAGPDDWDRWNESRDRDLERSHSYQYVDRSVYGAEDLDGQGEWVNVPPYGWVWSPYVASGWAPYRYGRWTWVDWYGWTWVSYDPWGWAPYHYGRWFWNSNRWCWWPGGMGVRTWWRPALVGFVGWGGGGGGFGIGFGRVGWVPLAPYEPFHPWYGQRWYRGGYGQNNVTIVNNTNITNIYRNARLDHAVTAVDGADFSRGRVGSAVRVTSDDLRQASLVQGPLPVTPQRDSLRMADRNVRADLTPRSSDNTRFYTVRQPARTERVPFDQQQRGIEQFSQSARGAAAPDGANSGWRRVGGSDDNAGRGWRRIGEAPSSIDPRTGGGEAGQRDNGGWNRFGQPDNGRLSRSSPSANPAPAESPRGGASSLQSAPRDNSAGGWNRFGQPDTGSRQQQSAPRYETPRYESPRYESPRYERSAPRSESPRMESPRAPEFSAPRGGGGGGYSRPESGGSGRGGFSAPSAPSHSAPPASSGGGGGGGGRSSSGGGGRSGSGGGGGRGR